MLSGASAVAIGSFGFQRAALLKALQNGVLLVKGLDLVQQKQLNRAVYGAGAAEQVGDDRALPVQVGGDQVIMELTLFHIRTR